jgi:MoaA/NifB/PqqE/SkfB family radical SAM enzyme
MSKQIPKITWKDIIEIEVELSSRCNASCPGCKRTMMLDRGEYFPQIDISLIEFQKLFDDYDLSQIKFKFCGVLGDPIMNSELIEICRYSLDKGAQITISTNGGIRNATWWKRLAKLSKSHFGKLTVDFAIDGLEDTNHIYRVGVKWKKVKENFEAYLNEGGYARWNYIVFDHNKKDLPIARKLAKQYNIELYTRRAWRNSNNMYVSNENARKNL